MPQAKAPVKTEIGIETAALLEMLAEHLDVPAAELRARFVVLCKLERRRRSAQGEPNGSS